MAATAAAHATSAATAIALIVLIVIPPAVSSAGALLFSHAQMNPETFLRMP
jgi:hypothetical protein